MLIEKNTKCNGCQACASICPKSCIEMVKDEEGFLYPKIDEDKCINCRLCEKSCPVLDSRSCEQSKETIDAYAVINKDDKARVESSSGGVFTAIASAVIRQGGVVFGATFNERFQVIHKPVETMAGLQELRGSKYVQSSIGNAYKQAEKFLQENRLVLFTGTPCQIGGLHAYLKKPYDNLLTQDIICHGVPSPLVWEKYVAYREKKSGGKTLQVSFRNKRLGWKNYSMQFLFSNQTEYTALQTKDPYMQVFLKNLCLRPSCYDCAFKTKARQSDFTLADFWGLENVLPNIDDDKGTSLVFIHSEKGRRIFNEIKETLSMYEVDGDRAILYNSAMVKSVAKPENRDKFMSTIQAKGFQSTGKFYKKSFKKRVRAFLARIKNKILPGK